MSLYHHTDELEGPGARSLQRPGGSLNSPLGLYPELADEKMADGMYMHYFTRGYASTSKEQPSKRQQTRSRDSREQIWDRQHNTKLADRFT